MSCFDEMGGPGMPREKEHQNGKGTSMSNKDRNRVLVRMGARQLTPNEMDRIAGGGGPFTRASLTGTGTAGSPDSDMDS